MNFTLAPPIAVTVECCTPLEQHRKRLSHINVPAIPPDILPHHASVQPPGLDTGFIWIQGTLLLPLRDTWMFLLARNKVGWISLWSGPVPCPRKQPCCTKPFIPSQHALAHAKTQLHQLSCISSRKLMQFLNFGLLNATEINTRICI